MVLSDSVQVVHNDNNMNARPDNNRDLSHIDHQAVTSPLAEIPRSGYFAIKRGRFVKNCIFVHWEDAKAHLQDYSDLQYAIFEEIDQALNYVLSPNLVANTETATDGDVDGVSASRLGDVSAAIQEMILPNPIAPVVDETDCGNSLPGDNGQNVSAPSISEDCESDSAPASPVSAGEDAKSVTSQNDQTKTSETDTEVDKIENYENEGKIVHKTEIDKRDRSQNVEIRNKEKHLPGNARKRGRPRKYPLKEGQNEQKEKKVRKNTPVKQLQPMSKRDAKFANAFEEKFTELCAFVEKNGNCAIPSTPENCSLLKWANQQRNEYRKLQSNRPSKLTAIQIQRLHDIGFLFKPKRTYSNWNERMEKLREFKKINGHVRVPVSHPELGSWVHAQRREHKLYIQNDPQCKMTAEKLEELTSIGFVFQAAKKNNVVDARSNSKTWEERYNELVKFRDMFGHTIVPQNYPSLGWWVNTQRKEYKKLKLGKKSLLTADRALKLAEIGFCFDASGKKGGGQNSTYTSAGPIGIEDHRVTAMDHYTEPIADNLLETKMEPVNM